MDEYSDYVDLTDSHWLIELVTLLHVLLPL